MPSQLYNNPHVYFVCARNFTWAGKEYKLGEKFEQDIAPGRLDMLVRNRWLYAAVDRIEDKPRHWHHHIWVKSILDEKLGLEKVAPAPKKRAAKKES